MKISSLARFFRLEPFDNESEQGRSDERYRLAAITMLANLVNRILSMLVIIFSVSLTVPYLGAERFGVWMTIASFVVVLGFMDLGVGNALTNRVALVSSKGSAQELCRTISSGIGLLLLLGLIMGAVLIGLANLVPWPILIKVHNINLNHEINESVVIFSGLFGLSIFTSGIQRVFAGLQRSFESHFVSSLGLVAVLLVMWIATRQEVGIPILLLVTFGMPSLFNLALIYLLYKRGQFKFTLIQSNIVLESRHIARAGGAFLLLQLGFVLTSGADSLIISSQLGAEHVAEFAIVMRLFQISTQPMNILNSPLWGAYADAHARNEKVFIRKTFKLSMMTSSIFATSMVFFLVLFGEQIVRLWSGNVIHISTGLLVAYGLWSIIDVVGNAFGVFLNGCGLLRPQIITVLFFCTAGIAAKIILIRFFGIEAMFFGAVLSYIFISSLVYGWIFRKELMLEIR